MKTLALLFLAASVHAQVAGTVINGADGRPIAGALVVLQGLDATGDPPLADSYVLESDSRGRFQADAVVPGRYEARAAREGFTAQPRGVAAVKYTPRFTVEAGQPVPELVLKLMPTGSISGRVLDADGDPVSHATVEALGYSYAGGKKELKEFARGFSDDRGDYRIEQLPPGRYFLKFEQGMLAYVRSTMSGMKALGQKPSYTFAPTFFPSATSEASAVSLDLPPGGELRDKMVLLRSEQSYTLRVTLNGPPGGRLMMSVFTPAGLGMGVDATAGVARSFPNSPPGTYTVGGENRELNLSVRQPVRIENGDVDVILTLHTPLTLNGAVLVEGGGKVPLTAVRVRVENESAGYSEASVKSDGTFSLSGLQRIAYPVRIATPAGAWLKSLRLGQRVLASPEIDMAHSSGPLTIALATDGATLDGTASDGATVIAVPAGALAAWPEHVRTAIADKSGKFVLRDLAPGDYQVFAFEDAEPGAPLDPDFRKPFEKQATTITVEPGVRKTVEVHVILVG